MKKTIFLFSMLIILVIAGCNEKDLIGQIDGTWHLQNYAVNGADQTATFDTTHAGFTWTFANGDKYSQSWQDIRVFQLYTLDTVGHYDAQTQSFVIDSITTTVAKVPTSYSVTVSGDWYLTNGNAFIETRDSVNGNLLYQIMSHSKNSLHLLYGNQDFYLSK